MTNCARLALNFAVPLGPSNEHVDPLDPLVAEELDELEGEAQNNWENMRKMLNAQES